MSGSYEESDAASSDMNSERISSIMYSKTNGLFYLCLNDGTAYVIPKVMEKNYDNSEFGVQELADEMRMNRSVLSKMLNAEAGQPTASVQASKRANI